MISSALRARALTTLFTATLASTLLAGPAVAHSSDLESDTFSPSQAEITLDAPASGVDRLAGIDRFDTAVAVSQASFDPGVSFVLIANGLSFPDALSGGPVAGFAGAPVLLVRPGSIPESVKDELDRLRPEFIVVLGGPGAVSQAVATELEAYSVSGVVDRLAGIDRFATSAAIADVVWEGSTGGVVYVTNGLNFPDALSAGPVAGLDVAPLLLVEQNRIPVSIGAQIQKLAPAYIVVIGGTGVVSDKVLGELDMLAAESAMRIAGGSRFETSANLSSWFWEGYETSTVFISNGMQFPDSLAVAPVATGVDGPLLLVQRDSIPEPIKAELVARKPQRIVVVGGPGAVSEAVAQELESYVVPTP